MIRAKQDNLILNPLFSVPQVCTHSPPPGFLRPWPPLWLLVHYVAPELRHVWVADPSLQLLDICSFVLKP